MWLLAVWQWAPEDDGGVQSCAGRLRFLTALLRCLGQVSPPCPVRRLALWDAVCSEADIIPNTQFLV